MSISFDARGVKKVLTSQNQAELKLDRVHNSKYLQIF